MRKTTMAIAMLITALTVQSNVSAQGFLKKLKDKANDVANKTIDKKTGDSGGSISETQGSASNTGSATANTSNSGSTGRPVNKVGEGIKNTAPPDVEQQITEAESAGASGKLSEARYSIQQALLGIELQMGREVLKSLPANVGGVEKDTTQDRVISTQWGWANLSIQRTYRKDDKQLSLLIGNNAMYGGFMDMLFTGNYMQSNGDTQNFKQVKIKGNKAVIKYDDNEGYTVLVKLGQSGMITFQGINYAAEQDILTAVNSFDIDSIKRMLGEK